MRAVSTGSGRCVSGCMPGGVSAAAIGVWAPGDNDRPRSCAAEGRTNCQATGTAPAISTPMSITPAAGPGAAPWNRRVAMLATV